jgi:hypothetical protein
MANLGLQLSDQTVGNILRRHDIPPAPKRKQATSWKDFIRAHMTVLVATDFFTLEVPTLRRLITYYVLFFIHLISPPSDPTREAAGRHPSNRNSWSITVESLAVSSNPASASGLQVSRFITTKIVHVGSSIQLVGCFRQTHHGVIPRFKVCVVQKGNH